MLWEGGGLGRGVMERECLEEPAAVTWWQGRLPWEGAGSGQACRGGSSQEAVWSRGPRAAVCLVVQAVFSFLFLRSFFVFSFSTVEKLSEYSRQTLFKQSMIVFTVQPKSWNQLNGKMS